MRRVDERMMNFESQSQPSGVTALVNVMSIADRRSRNNRQHRSKPYAVGGVTVPKIAPCGSTTCAICWPLGTSEGP